MEVNISLLSFSENNVQDAASLKLIFYHLSSFYDVISASFVCKLWRNSFDKSQLELNIEKAKKRTQRLVYLCFNIKPEWVKSALENSLKKERVLEKSVHKIKRGGLKDIKVKVNYFIVPKKISMDYTQNRTFKDPGHTHGNSPIIVMDIEYTGQKEKISWKDLINTQNLRNVLLGNNKWEQKRSYRDRFFRNDDPVTYYPRPDVRLATPNEICDLNLLNSTLQKCRI